MIRRAIQYGVCYVRARSQAVWHKWQCQLVQKAHSGALGREAWTCLANDLEHPSSPLFLQMDTQAASAAMTAVGRSVSLHVYSDLFTFLTRPRRLQPEQHNASIQLRANEKGESGCWNLAQLRAVRACARRAYTKCVASGYEPSFPRPFKQRSVNTPAATDRICRTAFGSCST